MSPSEHDPGASDELAPASRRTFLGLAVAAGGVGLTAVPTVGAGTPDELTIVTSRTNRDTVRAALDRLDTRGSGATASVEVAETSRGVDLFTGGQIDAFAGNRPLLPADRSRATEHGVDRYVEELATRATTLTRPGVTWANPLRQNRIAEMWRTDGSTSTWAEVQPTAEASASGYASANDASCGIDTDCDILVRGVRAAQYARGHGGVGYYEPDRDWLEGDPDVVDEDAAVETPIVRLAYLGVDRASLEQPLADDLVQSFRSVTADRVGEHAFFDDPYGMTAA